MFEIDREISWLDFNYRVLHTIKRSDIPLLEKFNFLGITESNLTEFISVRLSEVYEMMKNEESDKYEEKFKTILNTLFEFKVQQRKTYVKLLQNLYNETGVILYDNFDDMKNEYKKACNKYFDKRILPVLSPIAYDATKELPSFSDTEIHYFIKLKDDIQETYCFLNVPHQLERVAEIESSQYILIEEIITNNLEKLFVKKKIEEVIQFKTYRFIPSYFEDNTEFVTERMKRYLIQRDVLNSIIFLDVRTFSKNGDQLVKKLSKIFDVGKNHIFSSNTPIWLTFMSSKFYRNSNLEYKPFSPSMIDRMIGGIQIMKYIQKEDLVLHHPYDSFQTIIELVQEAADNDDVISIKQTLYRISNAKDSELIKALCRAAKKGKKVTVMLEIKARFSEKNNLEVIELLKNSGVNIVYGFTNMKVHCKILIITAKTKKGIRIYSQIGTGNYNESTSKIYTDLSLLTTDEEIGRSLNDLFNVISGFSSVSEIKDIYVSPKYIRKRFEKMIEKEIKAAKKGENATVYIKVNNICDTDIANVIYKAANKGVKFKIICRGVCSIVAGENIKIKSVIGRFLEHSRIFIFKIGKEETVMIGSSDLMTRNLDHRVEILVPVKDKLCRDKIKNIFKTTWTDTANSFIQKEGKYYKVQGDKNCHKEFIKEMKN